jgi:hypothetical protein
MVPVVAVTVAIGETTDVSIPRTMKVHHQMRATSVVLGTVRWPATPTIGGVTAERIGAFQPL